MTKQNLSLTNKPDGDIHHVADALGRYDLTSATAKLLMYVSHCFTGCVSFNGILCV